MYHTDEHVDYLTMLYASTHEWMNELIVRVPLPLMECHQPENVKGTFFENLDWRAIRFKFCFPEDKSEYKNLYLLDENKMLWFSRNGKNGEEITREANDAEIGFWEARDHKSWNMLNVDEESKLYSGKFLIYKIFVTDDYPHDYRIVFECEFKDGKLVNIQQAEFANVDNSERKRQATELRNWETRRRKKWYKMVDKYYWTPKDYCVRKLTYSISCTADMTIGVIHWVDKWTSFCRWR